MLDSASIFSNYDQKYNDGFEQDIFQVSEDERRWSFMGGGTNTVQQASDPWSGQQPYLTGDGTNGSPTGVMPAASNLYQNYTPQYYGGSTTLSDGSKTSSTVAPFSNVTGYYMNTAQNLANNDTTTKDAASNIQSFLNGSQNGLNPSTSGYQAEANGTAPGMSQLSGAANTAVSGNAGLSSLSPYASGSYINSNPGQQNINGFANGSYINSNPANSSLAGAASGAYTNNNTGENALSSFSNGSYLNAGNPYLSGAVSTALQSVMPQTGAQFESSGRYGSGAADNAMANAAANVANTDAYNNYSNALGLTEQGAAAQGSLYNTGVGNQITAGSNLGNIYNQGVSTAAGAAANQGSNYNTAVSTAAGAAANQGNIYNSAMSNQINAANGLNSAYNTGLTGLSNNFENDQSNQLKAGLEAPGIDQSQWNDENQLGTVGAMQDSQNQNLINANVNQWNYAQNLPYQQLNAYSALVNNGTYGMQGTTTQQMYSNPWLTAAGGVAAGAGAYNSLLGNGSSSGVLNQVFSG